MRRAAAVTAGSFALEHQCPQCGAPVSLEETDRIFACPYCRVRHYLYTPDYFRYYLPSGRTDNQTVFYLPYWRYKGMKIDIQTNTTKRDLIDRSFCATPCANVPMTLGYRSQTLKMKFVEPETPGRFLPPTTPLLDFLKMRENNLRPDAFVEVSGTKTVWQSIGGIGRGLTGIASEPDVVVSQIQETILQLFVGDVVSLIYAPFFLSDAMLFDGISGDRLGPAPALAKSSGNVPSGGGATRSGTGGSTFGVVNGTWFLPALCPVCGWDLQGEKESCLMVCPQCRSAWNPSENGLKAVDVDISFSLPSADVWVPFWRIAVECSIAPLASIADFYRLAGIPRMILPADEEQPFHFWIPAFKSNPELFLKLGKIFIMQQGKIEKPSAAPSPLYPVTLPLAEAFQGIAAFVTDMAPARKKIIPIVKSAQFSIKNSSLVFVPFVERGSEYVQPSCNVAINKNALRVGRAL
jgi:hypothetical protein